MKSRVLRTLMPRKARHAVSYDTYAPTALLKCFSSILIRYQYKMIRFLMLLPELLGTVGASFLTPTPLTAYLPTQRSDHEVGRVPALQ